MEICPICGNKNDYKYYYINSYIIRPEYYLRYLLCNKCKSVWQTPLPSKEYLNEEYKNGFYGYDSVANYLDAFKMIDTSRMTNNVGRTVLDIGCRDGAILKEFKDIGCQVFGIEPALMLQRQGLDKDEIYNGFAEDCVFSKDYFDLIIILQYLEKTYNPKEILKLAAFTLKPNGMIWIQSPFIVDEHYPFSSPDLVATYFQPSNFILISLKEMERLCLENNLKIINTIPQMGVVEIKKGE